MQQPINRSEAWFCGFFAGDGSSSNKYDKRWNSYHLSATLHANLEELPKVKKRLGEFDLVLNWRPGHGHCEEANLPVRIRDRLIELGFELPVNAYTKKLPKKFQDWSEENRWALLEGLIDSDGWIPFKGGGIYTGTRSFDLWEDNKRLCETLSLTYSLKERTIKEKPFYTIYVHRGNGRVLRNLELVQHKAEDLFTGTLANGAGH